MAQAVEINQAEISQIGQPTKEIWRLFPKQGEWTEADYFRLPETNMIVELSEGRLIISPSPTPKHQKIAHKLDFLISSFVYANNLGEIVTAPMDTRLYEGVVRQPDIEFMSNDHLDRITEEMWGVPDLAVEILSKSNTETDKEEKYREYQKAGVQEYWIVDPFSQVIEVYILENGSYELFGKWGIGEIAKSKLLDGLEINVSEVID